MSCKDCIHYEICEIMSDQYGISKIPPSQCGFYKPTADVVEVRHGEWIKHFSYGLWHYDCPFCDDGFAMAEDFEANKLPNYCSNCGAKMDGERKEECKQEK